MYTMVVPFLFTFISTYLNITVLIILNKHILSRYLYLNIYDFEYLIPINTKTDFSELFHETGTETTCNESS